MANVVSVKTSYNDPTVSTVEITVVGEGNKTFTVTDAIVADPNASPQVVEQQVITDTLGTIRSTLGTTEDVAPG